MEKTSILENVLFSAVFGEHDRRDGEHTVQVEYQVTRVPSQRPRRFDIRLTEHVEGEPLRQELFRARGGWRGSEANEELARTVFQAYIWGRSRGRNDSAIQAMR